MKTIKKSDMSEIIALSKFKPVILIFGSGSCPACMSMKLAVFPFLEKLETIHTFYVDIENDEGLSDEFEVEYLPTALFIKDSKVIGVIEGAVSIIEIKEKITEYFKGD